MSQNADVEWLRDELNAWKYADDSHHPSRVNLGYLRRLLAHIDQLEAANNWMLGFVDHLESKLADQQPAPATSVDEIAVQIYVRMMRGTEFAPWAVRFAEFSHVAAEALVAERERRRRRRNGEL